MRRINEYGATVDDFAAAVRRALDREKTQLQQLAQDFPDSESCSCSSSSVNDTADQIRSDVVSWRCAHRCNSHLIPS
jgi:hypothetical protein